MKEWDQIGRFSGISEMQGFFDSVLSMFIITNARVLGRTVAVEI
jgi:hypothetical protein